MTNPAKNERNIWKVVRELSREQKSAAGGGGTGGGVRTGTKTEIPPPVSLDDLN